MVENDLLVAVNERGRKIKRGALAIVVPSAAPRALVNVKLMSDK